jgi:uncharacterized protein YkwD
VGRAARRWLGALALLLLSAHWLLAQDAPANAVPIAPGDDQTVTSPAVTFSWTGAPGTAQQYTLRVVGVGFSYSFSKVVYPNAAGCKTTPDCAFAPTNLALKNNRTYRWFVVTRTAAGNAPSAKYDFITAFPKPAAPALGDPDANQTITTATPTFTWTGGAHTNLYHLRVFDSAGTLVVSRDLRASACGSSCAVDLSAVGLKLPRQGQYTWWVRGKNPYGGTVSAIQAFTYQETMENRLLRLVNIKRCAKGLAPLALNAQLNAAAQRHSDDMVAKNFFSHTGSDGSRFWNRIEESGYGSGSIGENIAAGQTTPQSVFNAWWNSEGHRKNIMNANAREMGIAYAYGENTEWIHYWTQVFATKGSTVLGVCP